LKGRYVKKASFYALMLQEQNEHKQVRPYILNILERRREPYDRII